MRGADVCLFVQGQLHRFASACMKRLGRVIERRELVWPSAEEIEHSRVCVYCMTSFSNNVRSRTDYWQQLSCFLGIICMHACHVIAAVMAVPRAGSGVVRIDPLYFLAGSCTRRVNKALTVLHLSIFHCVRTTFYVSLVFVAMCSVFWLFWLSCQYLSSDWLERLL